MAQVRVRREGMPAVISKLEREAAHGQDPNRAADQLDLAQDYGADFLLFKPLDVDSFLATVQEALELRK